MHKLLAEQCCSFWVWTAKKQRISLCLQRLNLVSMSAPSLFSCSPSLTLDFIPPCRTDSIWAKYLSAHSVQSREESGRGSSYSGFVSVRSATSCPSPNPNGKMPRNRRTRLLLSICFLGLQIPHLSTKVYISLKTGRRQNHNLGSGRVEILPRVILLKVSHSWGPLNTNNKDLWKAQPKEK